jgi:hypothetical protein
MYLLMTPPLVWEIDGGQNPAELLESLRLICKPGDKIVLGGYDTSVEVQKKLELIGAISPNPPDGIRLDVSCYEFNSKEWPRARAFEVIFSDQIIEELKRLCRVPKGGGVKDIFYDDLAAYSVDPLPSPLIDFNHATSGGGLCHLNTSIPEAKIVEFSKSLGMTPRLVKYPPDW